MGHEAVASRLPQPHTCAFTGSQASANCPPSLDRFHIRARSETVLAPRFRSEEIPDGWDSKDNFAPAKPRWRGSIACQACLPNNSRLTPACGHKPPGPIPQPPGNDLKTLKTIPLPSKKCGMKSRSVNGLSETAFEDAPVPAAKQRAYCSCPLWPKAMGPFTLSQNFSTPKNQQHSLPAFQKPLTPQRRLKARRGFVLAREREVENPAKSGHTSN